VIAPPEIEFERVSLSYGRQPVLRDVSLKVPAGSSAAVVGLTGVGKTTILRLIAGLSAPSSGVVRIAARPRDAWSPQQLRIAYVFQQPTLIPWLTARENVLLPSRLRGDAVSADLADHWLEQVQARSVAQQYPHQLSGGQAMRVSLARALLQRPAVLLLDEPFSALDTLTRRRMHALLLSLLSSHPCTMLLVTHDIYEAVYLADQVCVLTGQPAAGASIAATFAPNWPAPRPDDLLSSPELAQQVQLVIDALSAGTGEPV
jgi:ABC-type nitrate/sulfonate/bicarbonate transport system ATPase subunit